MSESTQSLQNHAKFVPLFHYVAFPLLVVNFGWAVYQAIQAPSAGSIIGVTTALAIIIVGLFARIFALGAQDRVIRLEMRLKLQQVLPQDMHAKINELTAKQMVALRFASDGELAELAQTVLRDNVTDQKAIKQMIKQWNPDHCRL